MPTPADERERILKPPRFSYARPETLDEALSLLHDRAGDAKIIAGGQSLMPMLNLRLAAPGGLIDINRVAELSGIQITPDAITIGAMTRHRTIETLPEMRAMLPLMPLAAAEIGHLAIRNRGTIGGSLVHADPAAEWPIVAVALDAQLLLRSARCERVTRAREFFTGPLTSAIEPDEMLTEIRIARGSVRTRFGFAELCRRRGDFALVAVACRIELDGRGACSAADVVVGGAHPVPMLVPGIADLIRGARAGRPAIEDAADRAANSVDPSSDIHASAEYRRRLVRVLVTRALAQCLMPAADGVAADG
jgi:aerobic carbon-monoxide dehydrogenase medium subunit